MKEKQKKCPEHLVLLSWVPLQYLFVVKRHYLFKNKRMGIIACCAESRKVERVELPLKDLSQPFAIGKNKLELFELSLPFCRNNYSAFARQVNLAVQESGSKFVSPEILRKHLMTDAWRPLIEPESSLRRLLSSPKLAGEEGKIDVNALKVFGLLHC